MEAVAPMSNLVARLLTAVLLIPVLVTAINWSNPLGVWLVAFAATVLGLREWMRMTLPERPYERGFCLVVGAGLAAAFYWLGERPMVFPTLAAGGLIATFLFFLLRYGAIETVASRMCFAGTGYFYVGLITYLALLKRLPDGTGWVYVALTIGWLSDTGAYFAGRFIGPLWPRKLYETVSPKKTVIGAFGGMLASVGALVLAKLWYLPRLDWVDCVALAVPANILGQCGDLAESLFKRSLGVKDSGALLPGHGGMLDRVDAVVFVMPYVYAYARWVLGAVPGAN